MKLLLLVIITLLSLTGCGTLDWSLHNPPHPVSDLSDIDQTQPEYL